MWIQRWDCLLRKSGVGWVPMKWHGQCCWGGNRGAIHHHGWVRFQSCRPAWPLVDIEGVWCGPCPILRPDAGWSK
jgi:hypothetical protein